VAVCTSAHMNFYIRIFAVLHHWNFQCSVDLAVSVCSENVKSKLYHVRILLFVSYFCSRDQSLLGFSLF